MIWYQKHVLRPCAREAAAQWVNMNPMMPGTPVVIPVSSKSAIIEYVQDQGTTWLFFFFSKGDDKPIYLAPEAVKRGGNRRLESRVKKARRDYRFSMLDAEREKLALIVTE